MSKLSEDKIEAIKLQATQSWIKHYQEKHGKNPPFNQLMDFMSSLNERNIPKSPEQLLNLVEEEKKIRKYAARVAFNEMISTEHYVLNLMPNNLWTCIVKGGHPSIIELGITSKDPEFKTIIRRAIRKAEKVYKSSILEVSKDKLFEYAPDEKKFRIFKSKEEHYPLLSEERIQVRVYEMIKVIDLQTGENVTRTKEIEVGMYKHFRYNPMVEEGRLDLTRELFAKGKLNDEDFEFDKDDDNI